MDVWTVISVLQAFPPDQCGERHSPTPKRYLAKKVKLYIIHYIKNPVGGFVPRKNALMRFPSKTGICETLNLQLVNPLNGAW